jgi:fatty acid desaturase
MGPLLVVYAWLTLVTWLQHTDVQVPHLDSSVWTWERGAAQSIDRSYHWILDVLHHRIGTTHQMHHFVPTIPHYHAVEATAALRTAFPEVHRVDPTPICAALWHVATKCIVCYKQGDGTYLFTPPVPTPMPMPTSRADVWRLAGKSYNLAPFAQRHPGGTRLIRDTMGADITYLVQSYHSGWSPGKVSRLIHDFEVPDETAWPPIAWDPIVATIQRDLSRAGVDVVRDKTPWFGVLYYLVLGTLYLLTLVMWLYAPTPQWAVALGVLGFLWGGLLQHEGSHSALTRTTWVNNLARYAIFPWSPPGEWFRRHIIQHHQYTNTLMDEDVQTDRSSLIRHHHTSPWKKLHALQMVTVSLFSVTMSLGYAPGALAVAQMAIVYLHWWLHASVVSAVLPFAAFGFVFIQVTQLSHIQADCFSTVLEPYPTTFVKHQVSTAVDYQHDNFWVAGLCIFLNYQTYHHLFPGMSHFQLYTKKPMIDRILAAHDIQVRTLTFGQALSGYWSYLARLSVPDRPA